MSSLALHARAPQEQPDYIIGPQDVLLISLYDQEELGGKYAVDADGTFTFPLIGRVKAAGLTLRQLEQQMREMLMDGYFVNPQLSVAVEQYRSQRVFIVGEVRNPGTYALTGNMSLIEAIALAGSALPTASGEALIVRADKGEEGGNGETNGPRMPGEKSEVEKVDLKALQSGELSHNVSLRDGDTIFVPRAETVYVFGHVKNPGAYPIQQGTTVLQALSLAGGVTRSRLDGAYPDRAARERREGGDPGQARLRRPPGRHDHRPGAVLLTTAPVGDGVIAPSRPGSREAFLPR